MKQNTKRLYSMIIALLFVSVALVWYFDMLVPTYTDLQASKGNQVAEQALLANETKIVAQFQTLLSSYESQTSYEQQVNAAMPVGPHLADAIAQVYGIAGANSIAINSMSIGTQLVTAPAANAGVTGAATTGQLVNPIGTITFTLGAIGSYENFQNFLAALQTNMRLFDVQQFSLSPAGGSGKGSSADMFTYDITVATYYQSQ